MRALGLEQVRTEAKGPAATRQFAAQLPKLPPDVQAALLGALADRGDPAARPAVVDLLAASQDAAVRLAAIGALGFLGEPADSRLLLRLLTEGSPAEQDAARTALTRLPGESVSTAVAAELKQAARGEACDADRHPGRPPCLRHGRGHPARRRGRRLVGAIRGDGGAGGTGRPRTHSRHGSRHPGRRNGPGTRSGRKGSDVGLPPDQRRPAASRAACWRPWNS